MYIRANVMTADPASIDDLVAFTEKTVLPLVASLPGYLGLSMAVERTTGRGAVVTFWKDLDSLRASESQVAGVRAQAAAIGQGSVEPEILEVVERQVRSLPTPGCWNRVTTVTVDPRDIDKAIQVFKTSTVPGLDAMADFCAATMNVDRERGVAIAVSTWRNREAMEESSERVNGLRQEMADKSHGTVTAIDEQEIVIAAFKP